MQQLLEFQGTLQTNWRSRGPHRIIRFIVFSCYTALGLLGFGSVSRWSHKKTTHRFCSVLHCITGRMWKTPFQSTRSGGETGGRLSNWIFGNKISFIFCRFLSESVGSFIICNIPLSRWMGRLCLNKSYCPVCFDDGLFNIIRILRNQRRTNRLYLCTGWGAWWIPLFPREIAQLVRVLVCHIKSRGFKPCFPR